MEELQTKENQSLIEGIDFSNSWKSIYIMQSENGEIKIGVSKNVEQRKRSIENNRMISVTRFYKTKPCSNAFDIEKLMHERFKDFRIRGEWFSCDMESAISVLDRVFEENAIFHISNRKETLFDYFRKNIDCEAKEKEEYEEYLEKSIDIMEGFLNTKNEQIERLISMVEHLQKELQRTNEEIENLTY